MEYLLPRINGIIVTIWIHAEESYPFSPISQRTYSGWHIRNIKKILHGRCKLGQWGFEAITTVYTLLSREYLLSAVPVTFGAKKPLSKGQEEKVLMKQQKRPNGNNISFVHNLKRIPGEKVRELSMEFSWHSVFNLGCSYASSIPLFSYCSIWRQNLRKCIFYLFQVFDVALSFILCAAIKENVNFPVNIPLCHWDDFFPEKWDDLTQNMIVLGLCGWGLTFT